MSLALLSSVGENWSPWKEYNGGSLACTTLENLAHEVRKAASHCLSVWFLSGAGPFKIVIHVYIYVYIWKIMNLEEKKYPCKYHRIQKNPRDQVSAVSFLNRDSFFLQVCAVAVAISM